MKQLILFVLVSLSLSLSAQSPQVINYQAIARRTDGTAISNKSLGVNFQLLQGGSTGSVIVSETQTVVTNQLGLFNTQIGKTTTLSILNWDSADMYLKTSIDTTGGTNFIELSVQQLVSVPFAFRASSVPSSFTNNVLTIGNKSYTLASVTNDTYSPGTNINLTGSSPNYTISATPSLSLLSPNTLSISGGNTVDIAPTLSVSNNVLTVGPTNNTVSLPATFPTSITSSGIGTISSAGTNSFDINIPQPNLAISANSLSVVGGNTVVLPAQAQTTITTSGIGTVTSSGTNSFNINIPATPQTSITSTGSGTLTSLGTNSFNINIPQPSLTLSGSNLSVSGGNTVILPSQIPSTLTSSGIGTITSSGTNSFDINIPTPSLTINSNSLSVVGGNTVILPSQPQTSITTSGIGTISSIGTNSFNINIPATPITTIVSSGIGTVTTVGTNSFDINIPTPSLTINSNSLSVVGGNTVILPTQAQTSITSSGIGTLTSLGTNSFDFNVPQPSLSISGNSISVSGGNTILLPTATAPTLSITGNSLSISGGNSVTVPASSIVSSGAAITTTLGTNSYSLHVPQPTLIISANNLSISGGNTVAIPAQVTQTIIGTGIATAGSVTANSFTIDVPNPTLSISGNSLSINGGNTVTLPAQSSPTITGTGIVNAGTVSLNNFTINVPNPTLSLIGNSLSINGGNTVTLPAQANQTLSTSGGIATVTNGINSATIDVPSSMLSSNSNTLTLTNGTVVSTATVPAQVSQTLSTQGVATVTNGVNSATITVANPVLSNTANVLAINQGTAVSTVTLPAQANQTLLTTGGIATVTNGINSATIDVPSSMLSSNSNTLTLTNGTVVSTATVPAQVSQTLSTQGVATVTNGVNSATITVANPVLSNTANVLAINQGTAVSTVTLPAQANQTLSTSGGIATVTNGINSATIDVPSSILSSSSNTLTLTNGTVVSTATVPAQISQTLSTQGVATVTNGANSATITVANPVLSNTANVLAINQGTAVSTVTLPAQVNQTISALGIATVTNGINSATISVNQPTFAYSQTTGSLTSGTSSAYITPSLTISGNTLSSGPTSNSVLIPTGWALNGNAGTTSSLNFIGTTDNIDLNFRVNNVRAGRLEIASGSVYFGYQAGPLTNTATANTAMGFNALVANTSGFGNTAIGYLASLSNNTGFWNTSVGGASQMGNTGGTSNTSLGYQSLRNNSTGSNNLAVGANALGSGVLGSNNTAVGFSALGTSTTGSGNTAVGFQSGNNNINGASNVFLGYQAGFHETGSNKLYISNSSTSVTPLIYGDFSSGRIGINTTSLSAMLTVDAQSLTAPAGIQITNARDQVGGALPFIVDLVTSGQTFGSTTYGRMIRLNNSTTGQMFDMGMGVANNFFIANGNNYTPAALNISTLSNVGINTAAPTATLHVVGTTRLVDGTQGAGKYLTSDASGNASWTSVTSGTNALWSTLGNTGTGANNFIGTTDNVSLKFRVNNQVSGIIDQLLFNTAFGYQAYAANTTGSLNTAFGYQALNANNIGQRNAAFGYQALRFNTSGVNNTGFGYQALAGVSTGQSNVGIGFQALGNNNGSSNIGIGANAMLQNTTGQSNIAIGLLALFPNTGGNNNTLMGTQTFFSNTGGSNNVALGALTGYSNVTGSGNVFIGNNAGYSELGSNKLYIANSSTSVSPLIYGDFASGVLGINTASTLASFDVRGGTSQVANFQTTNTLDRTAGIWLRNNNGTPSQWMLYNGGSGNGIGLVSGELYFESVGARDFLIRNQASNLTETFRILGTNGNVGLGVALPLTKLAVDGDISLPYTSKIILGLGGLGSGETISNSNSFAMQFNTNSIQRMRIDNAGNINLGSSTITPGSLLNVEGNIELSTPGVATAPARTIGFPNGAVGNHGQLTIQAKSNIFSGAATQGGNLMLAAGDFNVSGAGGSYGGEVIIRAGRNVFDGSGGGNIIFQAAGGAYTERMRIEGMTGRVGIGTNAPTALLHVNGTTRLVDGTQGAGKVLTSDASGNASWATPTAPSHIRSIIFEPGAMNTSGAYAAAPASHSMVGGWQRPCVIFADAATQQVQLNFPIPSDWNTTSTFTVRVLYGSASNTGNFDIQIFHGSIGLNATAIVSPSGGGSFAFAANATVEGLSQFTTTVSPSATDKLIVFTIRRNGGTGSDSSTSPMRLYGITFDYFD